MWSPMLVLMMPTDVERQQLQLAGGGKSWGAQQACLLRHSRPPGCTEKALTALPSSFRRRASS